MKGTKKEDEVVEFGSLVHSCYVEWADLEKELENDKGLGQIMLGLKQGKEGPKGFHIEGDRLFYKDRIVLPNHSKYIALLLQEYHSTPIGGHDGELKTYLRLTADWFWAGMRKDVAKFVRECDVCQRNKTITKSPLGLLQPLPIPEAVWEEISLDFVEGLPLSRGSDAVLVVVDRLSKYAYFIGLKHPFNALKVADFFVKEVVRLHGFPASIVSDRDRVFMSIFWKELFRLQGTHLRRSTSYHPQTDGQTEIVNKSLEMYLRCFIAEKPKSWARWLPWAEYSYNTSPHTSTKMTPFRVVYGRDPPKLWRLGADQTMVSSLEEMLMERDAILDELRLNLNRAQ